MPRSCGRVHDEFAGRFSPLAGGARDHQHMTCFTQIGNQRDHAVAVSGLARAGRLIYRLLPIFRLHVPDVGGVRLLIVFETKFHSRLKEAAPRIGPDTSEQNDVGLLEVLYLRVLGGSNRHLVPMIRIQPGESLYQTNVGHVGEQPIWQRPQNRFGAIRVCQLRGVIV